MRATSDQHISINTNFDVKPQSKETSGGNIKNKQTILMTNKLLSQYIKKD